MAKRDKWITKAYEFLGYIDDGDIKTLQDIDFEIKEQKRIVSKMEDCIEEAKELIEQANSNVNFLINLKNQSEIEEFKAMNPKAKNVFKL